MLILIENINNPLFLLFLFTSLTARNYTKTVYENTFIREPKHL